MNKLREYVPDTAKTVRMYGEKPWWQVCSVDEFQERISAMEQDQVVSLSIEIKGALSITQAQLSANNEDGMRDRQWTARARRALGFLIEKHQMMKNELHRRDAARSKSKNERAGQDRSLRDGRLETAKQKLTAGDLAGAIDEIIAIMERRGEVKP